MDIENTIGLFELETRKSIVLAGKITPIRVQNIEVNIVLCVLYALAGKITPIRVQNIEVNIVPCVLYALAGKITPIRVQNISFKKFLVSYFSGLKISKRGHTYFPQGPILVN